MLTNKWKKLSIDNIDNIGEKLNDFKHSHSKDNRHCKKNCQEQVNEFIEAASNIENALANAINAESEILRCGHFTHEELSFFTNKLENLLKLAIKKEIILEFLIEDVIKACKECERHKNCDCKHHKHDHHKSGKSSSSPC